MMKILKEREREREREGERERERAREKERIEKEVSISSKHIMFKTTFIFWGCYIYNFLLNIRLSYYIEGATQFLL